MKIAGLFNFPYQFLVEDNSDYNTPDPKQQTAICNKWCAENCKGMWLITDKTVVNLFAPSEHKSLIDGMKFPPSFNKRRDVFLVSFQEEDEAMAFKLMYSGEEKK